MRILFIPILLLTSLISDTYIHNSVIINSNIGDNSSLTKGSGILSTKNIQPIGHLYNISIQIPATVVIQQSSQHTIGLEMEKDFIDNVQFEFINNTLNISTKGAINTNLPIKITINVKRLKTLKVSSTAKVTLKGFENKKFELFSSGISKVIFSSGKIDFLSLNAKGASSVNLEQIRVKEANIVSKGTSSVNLNVSDNLTVMLSGIAKVRYLGNPQIHQTISGLGKLIKIK